MKPAFSVIFFTVSSGAGFGLIALLALTDLMQRRGGLTDGESAAAVLIALVLVTAGLLSSTLHLANRKNAWRAFSRFRSSWLSREGVFSLAFYPFALAYLLSLYFGLPSLPRALAAGGTLVLAWTTLYCTGMIYASLRPIPQWHTPLVPIGYVVLGHYSGALLLWLLLAWNGHDVAAFRDWAIGWLVLGAGLKAVYYVWMQQRDTAPTLNTATGITRGRVRLLDAGHSHGTFLTDEFGFVLAREHALIGRIAVFVLGFGVPLLALLLGTSAAVAAGSIAVVAAAVGLLIERWFFFAEARHVVRLYHGL